LKEPVSHIEQTSTMFACTTYATRQRADFLRKA